MVNWPVPIYLKSLRGFLGLTSYYKKFMKDYKVIRRSLTELLKKNNFIWNAASKEDFNKLKQSMMTAPIWAMLDFSKPFVIEVDAYGMGLGVVSMQGNRPIVYLNKKLHDKHMRLSIYEKELFAILMVVTKWRYYVEGHHFIIKIDHKSLKFLL